MTLSLHAFMEEIMIIAPSLLNSNIYDIQETVKIAKIAGDNYLHIDSN